MCPVDCKKAQGIPSQHLPSVRYNSVLICEIIKFSRACVIQQFFDKSFKATLIYLRLLHDSSVFLDKKYFFKEVFIYITSFLNAFVDFTAVRLFEA